MAVNTLQERAERRACYSLCSIAVAMTVWLAALYLRDPDSFVETRLGLNQALADAAAWIWCPTLLIIAGYTVYTSWTVPVVRQYIVRFGWLKLIAIWAAVVSGALEEMIFRQRFMDWLDETGQSAAGQVLIPAIAFGAAHAVWVAMSRDWRIIAPVVLSTTALGLALGGLYLLAGRSTFPPIVAHTVINLVIEPGLFVSAFLMRSSPR